MNEKTNGTIKLSWPQVAYGISVLTLILLTYADLKNTVNNLSQKMGQVYLKSEDDKIVMKLEQEDERLKVEIKRIKKALKIGDD